MLGVYIAYSAVRSLSGDEVDAAVAHGADIVRWQDRLGLGWETQIQSWTAGSDLLVHAANFVYMWFHLPALAIFAVWMIARDARSFPYLRNVWVLSAVIGLFFFYFYPVAPPRLLPAEYGFTDTLAQHSAVNYTVPEAGILMNKYAAFPSLHFAWSFIIAAGLYATLPWRWARWASLLFPVLSFWSILATANHFVLDALAGAILAALCFAAVAATDRIFRRRERWRSRELTGGNPPSTGEAASGSAG